MIRSLNFILNITFILDQYQCGMQLQYYDNPLWESKIESGSGTNMDPSDGTGGSVQVSPSMFTPDMRVCNGNWL